MTTIATKTFTHPDLLRFNGIAFPALPDDLKEFEKSEAELQAMSYQDLEDAVFLLEDPDFGLYADVCPWIPMYYAYRNSSQLNGRKSWNEVNPVNVAKVTKEPQMTTTAPAIKLSPVQLAANDAQCLDIIESFSETFVENLTATPATLKLISQLPSAIQAYIAADGFDGNKAHDALAQLANRLNLRGIFKLTGQIKNSPAFQDLVDKYTPDLIVDGGNQTGTIVSVGKTAAEVASKPQEFVPTKSPTTPQKPSKSTKGTKAQKPSKAAKEKAPNKEKTPTTLPPLPTLASIAELESLDRKALCSTMSAVNKHMVTGVKGNATSDSIKTALAKHLLNIDYTPAPKPAKGTKAPKEYTPMEIPADLSWAEVKDYGYKQLQGLAKSFRSNKLYDGNLAGKGIDKGHLLGACKAAMRQLGHEIIEAPLTPQDPDNAKPTLERQGMSANLSRQATELLAA